MSDVISIGAGSGGSYGPLSGYFVSNAVVAGIYYALPPLGNAPEAGDPIYDESRINIPGRDNTGMVRSGFVRQYIWADMVLIYSLASMGANKKNFLAGLRQLARYTITLPDGDSYNGCRLIQPCSRATRENIASGFVAVTFHDMCFESLSDQN